MSLSWLCPLCIQIWPDSRRESDRAVARQLPSQIRCSPLSWESSLSSQSLLVSLNANVLTWRTLSPASPRPSSSWDWWAPSLWLMRRVTGPGYYEPWRIASCYIVITNVKYLTQIFHTPRPGPGPSCFQLGISHCWVRGEFGMNGLKYEMIPCPLFSPFILQDVTAHI